MSPARIQAAAGRGNRRLRSLDETVGVVALALIGRLRRPRRPPQAPRRIGLMKTTGIGDMILLTAVARDAAEAFAGSEIVVVASAENAAVARLVAGVHVVEIPPARPLVALRTLRRLRLDMLVDFGQWSRLEAIYSALSGASWTAGFATPGQRRDAAYDATARHRDDVAELDNYRELAATAAFASRSVPVFHGAPQASAETAEPYAVFHLWPGGFASERREWPAERWRALAQRMIAAGYRVLLTGGPADVARSEAFARSCAEPDRVRSIAGRHSLAELVDVLAEARCVVSVNTGVMHMAAATGVLTIGLNGPTSSRRWGPIGPRAVSLDSTLPGCGFLNLGFEYAGRRDDCMDGISVERVARAALEPVHG